MKKVDFFIIGAPKCGTTSLAQYLIKHPDISFCKLKEPNYFSKDLKEFQKMNSIQTVDAYMDLFDFDNRKLQGEGSTTYLFSNVAVQNVLQHNPEAKLIVMLRNPIDMTVAWHSQKLKEMQEDEPDLRKAWAKQPARRKGREIPVLCKDVKMLLYKEWCLLGRQLQRLLKQVPETQYHIIFFDDLVDDTENVYRNVLQFLNLPYDGRTEFKAYNEYRECRNFKLNEYRIRLVRYRQNSSVINKWHKTLANMFKTRSIGVQKVLLPIIFKKAKRNDINEEFRKELLSEFHDDICLLEKLTGRNLGPWKR